MRGAFDPLPPFTPTGSMTLKVDHRRRVLDLNETYHTASHASFPDKHGSKSSIVQSSFSVFVLTAAMFEMATVASS